MRRAFFVVAAPICAPMVSARVMSPDTSGATTPPPNAELGKDFGGSTAPGEGRRRGVGRERPEARSAGDLKARYYIGTQGSDLDEDSCHRRRLSQGRRCWGSGGLSHQVSPTPERPFRSEPPHNPPFGRAGLTSTREPPVWRFATFRLASPTRCPSPHSALLPHAKPTRIYAHPHRRNHPLSQANA